MENISFQLMIIAIQLTLIIYLLIKIKDKPTR